MGPKGSTPHFSEPTTSLYTELAQVQSVPSHLMSLRSVSSVIHPTMPKFSKWPISLLPWQMASEVYTFFVVLNASAEFLAGSSYYITAVIFFNRFADFYWFYIFNCYRSVLGLLPHLKVHLGGFAWALTLLAFAVLCGTPHSSHSSVSAASCRHLLTFLM